MNTSVNVSQNTRVYRKLFSRLHREARDTELKRGDVGESSSAMERPAYSVFQFEVPRVQWIRWKVTITSW